jgi:hypothetical protein
LPTELPSGVTEMGARSYVPELGRFLQPDPIPGGSANAYAYTFGDPVNSSDPSGASSLPSWFSEFFAENAQRVDQQIAEQEREEREAAERLAAEEAAARAEAERKAAEAAAFTAVAGPQYEGGEEEEWEEEEGEYEYASYHHGAGPESGEAHVESGVLFQSLGEASEAMGGNGDEGTSATGLGAVPLCKAGLEGPCARDDREMQGPGGGGGQHHRHRGGGSNRAVEAAQTAAEKEYEARHSEEQRSIEEQYADGRTGAHEGNDDDGDSNTGGSYSGPPSCHEDEGEMGCG